MKKKGTLYLVQLALLVAIIILMAFTPIGYLRVSIIEITLIVIPVAVGAALMDPMAGAILGGVFGVTSFIQCFGMSPFGAALLQINPLWTFLVCVPTRILAGWLAGLIAAAFKKVKRLRPVSYYAASLLCPLLNTVLFTSLLCLFFFQTSYIQGIAGGRNVLLFAVFFVGINGVVEAIACFLVGGGLAHVLSRVLKNNSEIEA